VLSWSKYSIDYFLLICFLCLFSVAGNSQVLHPASAYLSQKVCDSGDGTLQHHTNADPYTCPLTARSLNIGEFLPYHKWDSANQNSSNAQISDSYPFNTWNSYTGTTHNSVVATEMWENTTYGMDANLGYVSPYFSPGLPAVGESAYDVYQVPYATNPNPPENYIYAAGTYDDGAGYQPIWGDNTQYPENGWILFPTLLTLPLGNFQGSVVSNIAIAPLPPSFPFSQSYNKWSFVPGYTYESGKQLDSLQTWHFSGPSDRSSNFETMLFTQLYGKTRWEAWCASTFCSSPSSTALARCPHNVNGGSEIIDGMTYYIQDCHDWSYVFPDPSAECNSCGWNPQTQWHIDPIFFSYNLIPNSHMECTSPSGYPGFCGGSVGCQSMGNWQRSISSGPNVLNWGFNNTLQGPSQSTMSCAVLISTPSYQAGQYLFQEVSVPSSPLTSYSWSISVAALNGSTPTPPGVINENNPTITAVFCEFDNNNNYLDCVGGITESISSYPVYQFNTFTKNPATAKMVVYIYPDTPNVAYQITDVSISPQP